MGLRQVGLDTQLAVPLLARQVAEDVRANFSGRVFEEIIPRNVRLSEAPSFGKPIILYDIGSTGAENYISLTEEVLSL